MSSSPAPEDQPLQSEEKEKPYWPMFMVDEERDHLRTRKGELVSDVIPPGGGLENFVEGTHQAGALVLAELPVNWFAHEEPHLL